MCGGSFMVSSIQRARETAHNQYNIMNNSIINGQISLVNSSIINEDVLHLVKDYKDGHKAFTNASRSAVGIFASLEDGEVFNISGWHKNPSTSLVDLADSLYY